MEEILQKIKDNVVQGRLEKEDEGIEGDMAGQPGVIDLVKEAIDKKVSPKDILIEGLTAGMQEVGEQYEAGEYLIPDMLAAAECVGSSMDLLEPLLKGGDSLDKGCFVIATVEGDLHDIGKNIVATMLKGSGYRVKDLGTGIPTADIVEAVREHQADYVGLSALLTTTMPHMQETVEKLKQEGLRDRVRVLIGGAPTSEEFAKSIGADAYCRDAFDAIKMLKTN
jgi:5-methyltetrahydrofolate--homocysteine methyltransferase